MAKIALVSDVHLGTRQYGVKERYQDFLDAFVRFGRLAKERKVDAVVIGGDLFDAPRPDGCSVYVAKSVVTGLKEAGIDVYGIDGNHDLAGEFWLKVIGAVNLIPYEATDLVEKEDVTITGVSYKSGRDLIAQLEKMSSCVKTDILVMHFALAEMNGGGSADTGVQELSPFLDKMGVKAVLMGHVHIPDCRRWNGVLYVNPGSTEMKSFNEPQEKYFYVLDTDTWEAEPVRIPTREMKIVEVFDEEALAKFQAELADEARKASEGLPRDQRPFYHVLADDSIEDVFKRVSKTIHDTDAIARIVMRSSRSRDLAPVVDRKESVATLESAIEARFPKDSTEAKLTSAFLNSPDPESIRMIVDRYMGDE